MEKVAIFTVVFSFILFVIGILAPRKSSNAKRARKARPQVVIIENSELNNLNEAQRSSAMRMAEGGTGNLGQKVGEFTSKYGGTLAGAGQGRER